MTTGTKSEQISKADEGTRELYPLDAPYTEVEIKIGKVALYHRLRRPRLDELQRHAPTHWHNRISDDETQPIIDRQAQSALWDELALSVRNYDTHEWREIDDSLKSVVPLSHKETAIDAMYELTTEFISASAIDEDALLFRTEGPGEIHVRQTVHDRYTIDYFLRKATESEWQKFTSSVWRLREQRIGKERRTGVRTEFRAGVGLFDATILHMAGVSVGGEEWVDNRRGEFIAALDPLLKSLVATTLDGKITPKLRD